MQITFSPQRSDDRLEVTKTGDVLTINGTALDLSGIAEGETLSEADAGTPRVVGNITRETGILRLTLVLPYGTNPPQQTRFPAVLSVTKDGPVNIPAYSTDTPENSTGET